MKERGDRERQRESNTERAGRSRERVREREYERKRGEREIEQVGVAMSNELHINTSLSHIVCLSINQRKNQITVIKLDIYYE